MAITGAGALEHVSEIAVVGAADVRDLRVHLRPFLIDGRVALAGRPLPNATLDVISTTYGWNGKVITDGEGRVRASAWEHDLYSTIAHDGCARRRRLRGAECAPPRDR